MRISILCGLCLALAAAPLAAQDPDPSPTAAPRSAEPIADGPSDFDRLDVDRDGWLSESEVQAHPQHVAPFPVIDRDGDGRLSSDEWRRRKEGLVEYDED